MTKKHFITSKIKELPDGTFVCFDFDGVHLQIETDVEKAIVEFESVVKELKEIKLKSKNKWTEEYESRERLNFQSSAVDGFAGEDKPIDTTKDIITPLNNYKFFE